MKPASQNIDITRGDFFSIFVRLRPKNVDGTPGDYTSLAGWTGKAKAKADYDTVEVLATFTVTLADQVAYPGGVLVSLDDTVTSTLSFVGAGQSKKIGIWDLEMTNTLGEPNTFLTGDVTLWKDVS